MSKTIPKGIPADIQCLRKKEFLVPSVGPFRSGRYADVSAQTPKDSILAKEEELRIRDKSGKAVATIARSKNAKVNQDLFIRAANSIINVAKKLRQDPITVAKLLEDGQVISGALTTAFSGMQSIVSYMDELRKIFPDMTLDQVPKDQLQEAIDQINQRVEDSKNSKT